MPIHSLGSIYFFPIRFLRNCTQKKHICQESHVRRVSFLHNNLFSFSCMSSSFFFDNEIK